MLDNELSELIFIEIEKPEEDTRVTELISLLNHSLEKITGASGSNNALLTDFDDSKAIFIIGVRGARPIACGGFRPLNNEICEIKRMFARENGKGVGRQILAALEQRALSLGYLTIQLETRRVNQTAVDFYLRNGYEIINNYGIYQGRPEAVCFAKKLM